ncbi:unnamed protein product [Lactuca virosa]|uniref:S-protein homolog n=1 Tax=Lactuca virosa TaxID=75947 RepID=A0AAU9MUS5_9ASTR|nr:unnamed protein product [Lactuca virosa]
MKCLFFLLFYIVITTNALSTATTIESPMESPIPDTSDKVCWLGSWSVYIYDAIKDPITVHIQSKEDDLGNRTVAFNDYTNWKFCLSSGGRTRFYAHFYWNSRTAFFDVYDNDMAFTYCTDNNTFKQQKCFWLVRDDGFYISRHYNPFPGGWTKLHEWS